MPPTSSRHFLYLKNGGRKFSEIFVPIYPTQRRHNSEDRGHQTHHPEELKNRNQSKEQNRLCIRVKPPRHMTTPCRLFLTACLLRSQKNENCLTPISYGTVQLTTAHHLI